MAPVELVGCSENFVLRLAEGLERPKGSVNWVVDRNSPEPEDGDAFIGRA